MNMRELDLSGVGVLLGNQDTLIPLRLKDNNDLSIISQKMVEYCMMQLEADPSIELTPENIVKLLSKYQKEESGIPHFAALEKYSGLFASAYKQSMDTLKNDVHKEVHNLSTAIESLSAEILQQQGVGFLMNGGNTNDDLELEEFDWDAKIGDTSTLLDTLKMDTRVLNLEDWNVNKCNSILKHAKAVQPSLELDTEARLNMIKMVVDATGMDPDRVSLAVDIVTTKEGFYNFHWDHFANTNKVTPFSLCQKYSDSLAQLHPIFMQMGGIRFELSDTTYDTFNANLKNITLLFDVMKYYMLCRRDYFLNSVILDSRILNKDAMPTFIAKDGSTTDISNHLKLNYVYPEKMVPHTGIMINTVINNKNTTTEQLRLIHSTILEQKRTYRNSALYKAFNMITHEFLKTIPPEMLPKHTTKIDFIRLKGNVAKALASTIHNSDGNIEDALYKFVIDVKHNDSPVQQMYQHYAQESIVALESMSSDTGVNLDMVEAGVCSKLVTNFLVGKFCK